MIERILAVASIIIGLPGFLVLFLTTNFTLGVVLVIVGALAVAGWAAVHFLTARHPYTVVKTKQTLEFTEGVSLAILTKEYKIKVHARDQRSLMFGKNGSDGNIESITWNGEIIPEDRLKTECGDIQVDIRLNPAPVRNSEIEGTLVIRSRNAFPDRSEYWNYVPDMPTKVAELQIKVPDDRPCYNVQCRKIRGVETFPFKSPTLSPDNKTISLEIKRPKVGYEYKITWSW